MASFEKSWLDIPNCTLCTEIQSRQNLGAEVQKITCNIHQAGKVSPALHF